MMTYKTLKDGWNDLDSTLSVYVENGKITKAMMKDWSLQWVPAYPYKKTIDGFTAVPLPLSLSEADRLSRALAWD